MFCGANLWNLLNCMQLKMNSFHKVNFPFFFFHFFSWQKESKFLFSQVRLPPEDTTAPIFSEGMEVEVYSRSNDREACGWWCADIKVCVNIHFDPAKKSM